VLGIVWTDILALLAILTICGGMWFLASRIEPHWVSRDRSRFFAVVTELDQWGAPVGRKREVRIYLDDDSDSLLIARRSVMRPNSAAWVIKSKAPKPPRGRVVFLLRSVSPAEVTKLALRVPTRSKILPRLEEMLEVTGDEAELRRQREAARNDDPPAHQSPLPSSTEVSGSRESRPPDPPIDRG